LGTLSTIVEPETHLFSKATLLLGEMITQNFLIRQFFSELEHTAPSVNRNLIDFRPMNPRSAIFHGVDDFERVIYFSYQEKTNVRGDFGPWKSIMMARLKTGRITSFWLSPLANIFEALIC
jgi:hypothetical protein